MYCAEILPTTYWIFSSEVPPLLYYSHIPALVVALLLGTFVFLKSKKTLTSTLLFILNLVFSAIVFINLLLWTNSDVRLLSFAWAVSQPLFSAIPLIALYLFYAFTSKEPTPILHKSIWAVLFLGVVGLSFSHWNVLYFDATSCEVVTTNLIEMYQNAISALAVLWLIIAAFVRLPKLPSATERRKGWLFFWGIFLFLSTFVAAWSVASSLGYFEVEQYGLYGMLFFMGVLTYLIVEYRAFNIGLIASQALIVALVILLGSQFTFVTTDLQRLIIGITLALTGAIGIVLMRSVRREIQQRKQMEELAKDLDKANKQQIILIHFITHQIKGFLTKSRNIFAMAMEGDLGPVPETMKPMLEEGFKSDTKGVNTVQEILNAANIKSGKVTYTMNDVDLKAIIEEVAGDLRTNAEAKGLALNIACGTEPVVVKGDRIQLVNAFKNLIDNSIKYTPSGSVNVSLSKEDGTVRFKVEDTGVGISKEDMARLFTEGGHGTNSKKVNVESTGFGLYIVKNIIEAHHGKVWAESDGEGKGSRFIAEIPA